MKPIHYFLLVIWVLSACGECDSSKFYQIKTKDSDGDSAYMCRYQADGLGPCNTWQPTESLHFTDSCKKFKLSQILSRAQMSKYK